MKLYYSPGACSLSPHIVALEAGIDLKLEKVDTKTKTVQVEGDFWSVNPKGYVPALELDNGEILTEGPAIVQYLAALKPGLGLAPASGSWARVRRQGAQLHHLGDHKSYSLPFQPKVTSDVGRRNRKPAAALFAAGCAARGPQVPLWRPVHRRRRLPVRRHELGEVDARGPVRLHEPSGFPAARCRKARGAGGDGSGGPAEVRKSRMTAARPAQRERGRKAPFAPAPGYASSLRSVSIRRPTSSFDV
jgi:hypothetical protein